MTGSHFAAADAAIAELQTELRAEIATLNERVEELERQLETLRCARPAAGWLGTKDACAYLGGISRSTLWVLAGQGEIEREYVGRKPIFRHASIDAYIERR